MAKKRRSLKTHVVSAQQAIFNRLCIYRRRSNQTSTHSVRAEDLRKELSLPADIFGEALDDFIHAEEQMVVEVYQWRGESYLRLGEVARENCAEWNLSQKSGPVVGSMPPGNFLTDRQTTKPVPL